MEKTREATWPRGGDSGPRDGSRLRAGARGKTVRPRLGALARRARRLGRDGPHAHGRALAGRQDGVPGWSAQTITLGLRTGARDAAPLERRTASRQRDQDGDVRVSGCSRRGRTRGGRTACACAARSRRAPATTRRDGRRGEHRLHQQSESKSVGPARHEGSTRTRRRVKALSRSAYRCSKACWKHQNEMRKVLPNGLVSPELSLKCLWQR